MLILLFILLNIAFIVLHLFYEAISILDHPYPF